MEKGLDIKVIIDPEAVKAAPRNVQIELAMRIVDLVHELQTFNDQLVKYIEEQDKKNQ